MAKVTLVKPDRALLSHIARMLRASDVAELQAMHGDDMDMLDALMVAVAASEEAWVALAAGEPIAVFGLAPVSLLGGQACPWMLGTDGITACARQVVTLSKAFSHRWAQKYDQLFNHVDARNTTSIAWLAHTGYVVLGPQPRGLHGEAFRRFEWCA